MGIDERSHPSNIIRTLSNSIHEATSQARNRRLGNFQAAESCKRAIDEAQAELGENDPHILDAWEVRASLLAGDSGFKALALEAYEECLERRKKVDGDHDVKTARTKLRVAHLRNSGDLSLDDQVRKYVLSVAETHIYVFDTAADLTLATHVGDDLRRAGEFDDATRLFGLLLSPLEGPSHNTSFRTIITRCKLAQTLLEHAAARRDQSFSQEKVDEARQLIELNLQLLSNADARTRILRKTNEELLHQHALPQKPSQAASVQAASVQAADNHSNLHRDLSSTTLLSVHQPHEQRGRALSISHIKSELNSLSVPPKPDILKTQSTSAISTLAPQVQQKDTMEPSHTLGGHAPRTTHDPSYDLTGVGGVGEEDPAALEIFRESTGRTEATILIAHVNPPEDAMTTSTTGGVEMALPTRRKNTLVADQRKSHDGISVSDFGAEGTETSKFGRGMIRDLSKGIAKLAKGLRSEKHPDTPPAGHYAPAEPVVPQGHRIMSPISSVSTFDESVGRGRDVYLDSVESDVVKLSGGKDYKKSHVKSDGWFFKADKLQSTHELLYDKNPHPREEGRPVRVCIIDTGLDGCHPFLIDQPWGKGWGARIKKCHDFSSGRDPIDDCSWKAYSNESYGMSREEANMLPGFEGFVDIDGHGTHCAGIILQTAPKADLYIAKVGSGRNEPPKVQVIANAIEHAAKSWEVDIISMSIGFARESDRIRAAIQAHCSNVIFIAAAGNEGGDQPKAAFPARMRSVICMRATDGDGNDCSFNNWGEYDGGDKFHTLGQDVLSMWTTQTQPKFGPFVLEKRASGTSAATPVAAGIAALVLDFVRQKDLQTPKDDQPEYLAEAQKIISKSPSEKMRVIFRAMCTQKERDGWRYLHPWYLLSWDKIKHGGDWQGNAEKLYKTLDDRRLYPPNQKRRASAPETGNLVKEG